MECVFWFLHDLLFSETQLLQLTDVHLGLRVLTP